MHLFGYIDPGSGSLLLQALLAAILSIPFVFRRTIGGFWHRLRGTEPADEPAAEPAPSKVRASDSSTPRDS